MTCGCVGCALTRGVAGVSRIGIRTCGCVGCALARWVVDGERGIGIKEACIVQSYRNNR